MPTARRRTVAVTAPPAAWQRLGRLLEDRRRSLGHTWRTTFESETREIGARVNRRMQADFESAAKDRINHFSPSSFRLVARGYRVTEESMLAVLRGEADELVPAPAPAPAAAPPPAVPGGPPGRMPPFADPARIAAARPYYDQIRGRLDLLRAQGTAEPSGRQLFPDAPADARDWDGVGARLDTDARVWLIAELRAGEDARAGSRPRAAGA